MSRFEGKTVIVTGARTGIGAATARRLAQDGASVILTGRRPAPIEAVAASCSGVAVAGDAASPDHAAELVDLARDRFGEKPLFYAAMAGQLVFASEIKALRRHPGSAPH